MMTALENFIFDLTNMTMIQYLLAAVLIGIGLFALKEQMNSGVIALFWSPVLVFFTLTGMLILERSGIAYTLNFSPVETMMSGAFAGLLLGYLTIMGALQVLRTLR